MLRKKAYMNKGVRVPIAIYLLAMLAVCPLRKAFSAQPGETAPAGILRPATEAQGYVIQATAPDGKAYPVFRLAEDSRLVQNVRVVLSTSFTQQVLRLDRYARDLLLHKPGRAREQRLTEPMYLLLSGEEGGFARFGFWLEGPNGGRRLVMAGYVDLVVRRLPAGPRPLPTLS